MSDHPIPSALFREAMAHFASGVTVVTAGASGGLVGLTATGFNSVSLAPPLVLVCVGKRAGAHDGIVGAARFGVSILSERQGWIAEQFARSGIDRFRGVTLRPGTVPWIDGANALLACRHHARHDAGDHSIVVGEVVEAVVAAGRPLVHCARHFGAFVADTAPRSGSSARVVRSGGEA